jgi:hypothetical protein
MNRLINLVGKKFGRLLVQERVFEKQEDIGKPRWKCKCDCGNTTVVVGADLRYGNSTSCGCYAIELNKIRSKRYNKYRLYKNCGVGFIGDKIKFYFDREDYDLIKDFKWNANQTNHIYSTLPIDENNKSYKQIFLHRLILGIINVENDEVDHKDKNPLNNRKSNLEITDHQGNMLNLKTYKTNKTGIRGVSFDKRSNGWIAKLQYKKELVLFTRYGTFEEAIIARLNAEKEYFGNTSPQKHLFKKYNII